MTNIFEDLIYLVGECGIDDNDQLTQIFTQLDRLGVSAQYWLEEWTTEGELLQIVKAFPCSSHCECLGSILRM